jgi:hypothetical protein
VLRRRRGGIGREFFFRGWRICWSARRVTTVGCCQYFPGYKTGRATYESLSIVDLLTGGDVNGLDEELVAAFGIWRRVLFHSLQENYVTVLAFSFFLSIYNITDPALRLRRHLQCDLNSVSHSTCYMSTWCSVSVMLACGVTYCLGAVVLTWHTHQPSHLP